MVCTKLEVTCGKPPTRIFLPYESMAWACSTAAPSSGLTKAPVTSKLTMMLGTPLRMSNEVPTPIGYSMKASARSRTWYSARPSSFTVMRSNSKRPQPMPAEAQVRARSPSGRVGARRAPKA